MHNQCPTCLDGYGWTADGDTCLDPTCPYSLHGLLPGDPEANRRKALSIAAQGGRVLCLRDDLAQMPDALPWFPPAPAPGPASLLELPPDDWALEPKID